MNDIDKIEVTRARRTDLEQVADIAWESFRKEGDFKNREDALDEVTAKYNAISNGRILYPLYVARRCESNFIYGYLFWLDDGGKRDNAVLKLDQPSVRQKVRKYGIGAKLVHDSLLSLINFLDEDDRSLGNVWTTCRPDRRPFYEKALGAKVVAKIPNLYKGPELVMQATAADLRRVGYPV